MWLTHPWECRVTDLVIHIDTIGLIIVCHVTDTPLEEAQRVEIIRYLRNVQREDGGWGLWVTNLAPLDSHNIHCQWSLHPALFSYNCYLQSPCKVAGKPGFHKRFLLGEDVLSYPFMESFVSIPLFDFNSIRVEAKHVECHFWKKSFFCSEFEGGISQDSLPPFWNPYETKGVMVSMPALVPHFT